MNAFAFQPTDDDLRNEIREFMRRSVTDAVRSELAEGQSEHSPDFHKLLGKAGWIGLEWPREYGGRGAGHMQGAIYQEETAIAGAPVLASNLSSIVGNTLIGHASKALKQMLLPGLISGDTVMCLGYSEPAIGSDLGAVATKAVRRGNEWIISGQKMWTSLGHVADFMFCAARTSAEAPKHRGISVFAVPMSEVEVEPIWTLGGFRTNVTYLDEVAVPAENLVGEENGGWVVLMAALDFERAGTARVGQSKRLLGLIIDAMDETHRANPQTAESIGALGAEILAIETLAYTTAWIQDQGQPTTRESSMAKVAGTELVQRVANFGIDVLGNKVLVGRGGAGAVADGELEAEIRNTVRYTVTAGTNEIQRTIIAQRGLGLPRGTNA